MLETMGKCLRAWMEERDLTIAQVTEMAGYKSTTSVVRLMQDSCEEQTRVQFMDGIRDQLEPEWQDRFEKAQQVSSLGKQRYRLFQTMDRTLFSRGKQVKPPRRREEPSAPAGTLYILGCPWREAFRRMEREMAENPGLQVRHFVTMDEMLNAPDLMEGLMTHIVYPGYQALLIDEHRLNAAHLPWNMLLYRRQAGDAAKESTSTMLILTEKEDAHQPDKSDRWQTINLVPEHASWIASQMEAMEGTELYRNDRLQSGTDYIRFLQQCYELEKDRRLASIRLTPGISMVPTAIMRSAFEDYLSVNPDPIIAATKTLTYLQSQRNQNFYQRKQGTEMIFSETAMRDFLRTGRMQDAFFASRPFTPEERKVIVQDVLNFSRRKGVKLRMRKGPAWDLSMEAYEETKPMKINRGGGTALSRQHGLSYL